MTFIAAEIIRLLSDGHLAGSIERGEEPGEKILYARVGRSLGRKETGDVALGEEWCHEVGISRQHVDRHGPAGQRVNLND